MKIENHELFKSNTDPIDGYIEHAACPAASNPEKSLIPETHMQLHVI